MGPLPQFHQPPVVYCPLTTAHFRLPTALQQPRKSRCGNYASIVKISFPNSKRFVELFEGAMGISYGGVAVVGQFQVVVANSFRPVSA